MDGTWTRREAMERALFAAAAAAAPRSRPWALQEKPAPAAKDPLQVAIAGVKGRGLFHVQSFLRLPETRVAAIVDVDEGAAAEAMRAVEKAQGRPPRFEKDLRKVLEDPSIGLVSIATTDHTHALLALWALQAGKHVYVEKPVSHNVFEGRKLVEAARKYARLCQAGHQCRSSKGLREAMAFLHGGELGRVRSARGLCYKRRGSIGRRPDGPVPAGVDYDLWLGPAPERPFNPNRFHYNWHWFWDYGASDLTAQGVHQMDIARWGLGQKGLPRRVASAGGRFGYEDQGEVPNTQIAWYDYGDAELLFEVRGLESEPFRNVRIGVLFECEKGYVVNPTYTSATAFDRDGKIVARFGGGEGDHFRNLVTAIRDGKPQDLACDIEEGHLSAAVCHLAQISYRLGAPVPLSAKDAFADAPAAREAFERMRDHLRAEGVDPDSRTFCRGPLLEFDGAVERFIGPRADEANRLLTRAYRTPFVVPEKV